MPPGAHDVFVMPLRDFAARGSAALVLNAACSGADVYGSSGSFASTAHVRKLAPTPAAPGSGHLWPFAGGAWDLGLSGSGMSWPSDVKARPDTEGELWITSNYDDSAVIVDLEDGEVSHHAYKKDDLGYHYMANVSSIAFGRGSKASSFATCQDSNNDYDGQGGSGNAFMGPTLWDSRNYAEVNQYGYGQWTADAYGSHMDMLHQSPFCRGIAHNCEDDNVYYATDGRDATGQEHGSLLMYDFVEDHGAGGNDHTTANVWRFRDVYLPYVPGGVPGHLQMDCTTGWLYVADTGNDRVLRVNVSSGSFSSDVVPWALQKHELYEYRYVDGAQQEVVISSSSVTGPAGLLLLPEADVLFVSEFASGSVRAFRLSTFEHLATLPQAPGVGGLEFSQGQLWTTNAVQNSLWSTQLASSFAEMVTGAPTGAPTEAPPGAIGESPGASPTGTPTSPPSVPPLPETPTWSATSAPAAAPTALPASPPTPPPSSSESTTVTITGTMELTVDSATEEQVTAAATAALAQSFSVAEDLVDVVVQQSSGRRMASGQILASAWLISYTVTVRAREQDYAQFDAAGTAASLEAALVGMGVAATVTSLSEPVVRIATTDAPTPQDPSSEVDDALVSSIVLVLILGVLGLAGATALCVAVALRRRRNARRSKVESVVKLPESNLEGHPTWRDSNGVATAALWTR